MKWIKLLTSAHVNGALRHPHEGVLHLEDAEAERLIENEAGEDVSADFKGADAKDAPVESVTTVDGKDAVVAGDNPHQSEVAPATDDKPAGRKAAANKE